MNQTALAAPILLAGAMVGKGSNRCPIAAAGRTMALGPQGHIVFVSDRDGNDEIYVMNADGTRQARLTNNPARDWEPAWAPDGSKLAFASDRDGNLEVHLLDAKGEINITNNPASDWQPDWGP